MLIKLLKHEFKTNRSAFITLYLSVLVLGFITRLTTTGTIDEANPIVGLFVLLYILAIFGTLIYVFVAIIMSFTKTMFKKPGYLTLTLPVSTTMIIISKMIMAAFWFTASMFVIILSSLILVPDAHIVFSAIGRFLSHYGLDMTFWLMLILMIVSMFESILLVYLCVTFVHTKFVKGYRGIIGVVLFIVLSYIVNFIQGQFVPSFSAGVYTFTDSDFYYYASEINNYVAEILLPSIVVAGIAGVLCFIGIKYLIEKKIELD